MSAANVNQFSFGDGRTLPGNGADADWDWIRVWQVPVSPTVAVLGDSGWQVSWDSSLDPVVDIAVDAVTENAVFIEERRSLSKGNQQRESSVCDFSGKRSWKKLADSGFFD